MASLCVRRHCMSLRRGPLVRSLEISTIILATYPYLYLYLYLYLHLHLYLAGKKGRVEVKVEVRASYTMRIRRFVGGSLSPDLLCVLAGGFHLPKHHVVIQAACTHEVLMTAALDDAAVFHQEDQVGATHGGETVCNHERGSPGKQRGHGGLDQLLAFRIQVARSFVEDEDLR